jgi:hypothetical protein
VPQEKKTSSAQRIQEKSHTEEKRTIPVIRTIKKEKSPEKFKGKTEVYYFPYDQGTKKYQFMFLEDVPTTREEYKTKEKEWLGFERALNKIGLDKDEVLHRIKKGLPPHIDREDQGH